jgi:hypothetical protein
VFVDRDDESGEWRVRCGTAPASGTEQASLNRSFSYSFPFPEPTPAAAPLFFRDAVGVGVGVSPARSSPVHCGAPDERARVGRRNARVSTARATGAPLVACARRRDRARNVISTLCRMGAVAEIACSFRCGRSSSPSSSSSCLGLLFAGAA